MLRTRFSEQRAVGIEPEKTAEEGYHFLKDMTNKRSNDAQQKALMPDNPSFMVLRRRRAPSSVCRPLVRAAACSGHTNGWSLYANGGKLNHCCNFGGE